MEQACSWSSRSSSSCSAPSCSPTASSGSGTTWTSPRARSGSVLAAVGTALPETMIPLVAILLGGTRCGGSGTADGIGVGAILGAPFMLSTLAMFVTGVAVVLRGRSRRQGDLMPVNTRVLGKDVTWFFGAYALAVGAAFLPADAGCCACGVAIVAARASTRCTCEAHFAAESEGGDGDDLAPLRLHRLDAHPPPGHPGAAAPAHRVACRWSWRSA